MKDPAIKPPQDSPHFPDSFHRVVIKGLLVREGKVLLCHDFSVLGKGSMWELPGGGLDFGETFSDTLKREVREEMGLEVTSVAEQPSYVWTNRVENTRGMEWWCALLLAFRFDVKTLDTFTPSEECQEMRFFSKEDLVAFPDSNDRFKSFAELFNPADFV